MFSAFFGGFLGASLAMHSGIVAAIFQGIAIMMALAVAVMVLWFLVLAIVDYVGIPLWRFIILPAMCCFVAVIGAPFYVLFVLPPWCLRRLGLPWLIPSPNFLSAVWAAVLASFGALAIFGALIAILE